MGGREDVVCDDFKTVSVPHLNRQLKYKEITCAGYDINGNLKIPDLAKCEPTYECFRWQEDQIAFGGKWEVTSCGLSPGAFSHCTQCNMCTPIENAQIKVGK